MPLKFLKSVELFSTGVLSARALRLAAPGVWPVTAIINREMWNADPWLACNDKRRQQPFVYMELITTGGLIN